MRRPGAISSLSSALRIERQEFDEPVPFTLQGRDVLLVSRKWSREGAWEALNNRLRALVRKSEDKDARPTARAGCQMVVSGVSRLWRGDDRYLGSVEPIKCRSLVGR